MRKINNIFAKDFCGRKILAGNDEMEGEKDSEKIKLFKEFLSEIKNQMLRYINTC